MRRILQWTVCVAALLSLAASAPAVSPGVTAQDASCQCPKGCKVPVFVSLENGKIVVEPEVLRIYWGTTVVFEVEADARELVEIEFERSPFKKELGPGWFGTRGAAKVATGPALRLQPLPPPDPEKIGRQKPAEKFKYTVRWSGGRAGKEKAFDPMIIITDNGI